MGIELKTARLKLTLIYIIIFLCIVSMSFLVSLTTHRSEVQKFRMNDDAVERTLHRMENRFQNLEYNFRNRTLIFDLVLLIPSAFVAYFLSGATLKPIEKSLKQKEEFAGDVSHELRTPVQNIKLEVENIKALKNASKNDYANFISSVEEEADRIQSITDSLLTLVRIDKSKTQNEKFKAKEIIDSCIEGKRYSAKEQGLTIVDSILDNFVIEGSKDQIQTSLSIILDNAIKYSNPKSKIIISSKIKDKNKIISVLNQGIGVKKENLGKIFESFYREDNTVTRKVQGSGIGLSLVKKIAEKNNFIVDLKSREGRGTEVTLTWSS
ncbi:HAMP domain-containing histidine kinase [bacterium]|nr:HAMP domain-containing histidine kinase [bacterium]